MSTWGYKLYEDDTFCEVVDAFKSKIRCGFTAKQATDSIRHDYEKDIDFHIAQFAIAECLWQIGKITADDISLITQIVDSKTDLAYWRTLDADEFFISRRYEEIHNFLIKISKPPEQSQNWKSDFPDDKLHKGDCFWYRSGGNKYGAIVMEIQSNTCDYYLVALTDALSTNPSSPLSLLNEKLFTVAWFSDISLLSRKRMHMLGAIKIKTAYLNRYGLQIKPNNSVCNTNCGQAKTWSHEFCSISIPQSRVGQTLFTCVQAIS